MTDDNITTSILTQEDKKLTINKDNYKWTVDGKFLNHFSSLQRSEWLFNIDVILFILEAIIF